MKTIYFSEWTYILHRYRGEISISNDDFIKLVNEAITMDEIIEKYSLDYDGDSTPFYEVSKDPEYEYDGCKED